MLVSVITAVKNGEAYVLDCIRSVESQTYPDIEHVIVDGASTDGTVRLVRQYAAQTAARASGHRVQWVSGPDAGAADATGRGVRLARGAVLVLLPADDRLYPSAVESAVTFLAAHPSVDVVIGDSTRGLPDGRSIVHVEPPFSWRRYATTGLGVTPQATFMRRRVIVRHAAFDAQFGHFADWEWFARILRGRRVANMRQIFAHAEKRPGAINLSGPPQEYQRDRLAVTASLGITPRPWPVRFGARCCQAVRRRILANVKYRGALASTEDGKR